MYTISDLKNGISRKLHGTSANQIKDFYGLLYEVAIKCQEDCDFDETRRTLPLTTPLYGQAAYDYACPADLKGNRLIDLRPQTNRHLWDIPTQSRSMDFDLVKANILSGSNLEVHWDTYIKTLRIALPALSNVLVNSCDGITENGTWISGPGTNDAVTDNLYYATGSGSIKYSIGTNYYLENATMSQVDLTNYKDRGVMFCWAYITATIPTAYALRWGTDTTANYWNKTVTAQWDGTAFRVGWNLLGFDWQTASKVGTPDASNVNSIRFSTSLTGTDSPVYFDGLTCSLGSIYEIEFYSKYMFRDSMGAFKEKPTADTDMLNLDTDSYGVFTNCLAWMAALQQQGKDTGYDVPSYQKAYAESVISYNGRFPSQALKTTGSYYRMRKSSYASKLGGVAMRP